MSITLARRASVGSTEALGRDALGLGGAGGRHAARAAEAMQAILVDDRLDPWRLGDSLD
jgi:hypothetical protein